MSDEQDPIVQEFLVESYENLDRLDQELVSLEEDPTNRETLASVFRTIHTIKGTSGFLGFSKLESLTHVGENLLSKLRDAELDLNEIRTTALLAMVDAVREILSSIESSGNEPEIDYGELSEVLSQLQQGESDGAVPRVGDILIDEGKAPQEAVLAAAEEQRRGDERPIGEILVDEGVVSPSEVGEALNKQASARARVSKESNVRVDVRLLDKLMNLVGELVLVRNQTQRFMGKLEDSEFVETAQLLNMITTDLQESVMKTRMQPIGTVWNKIPRVARDLAVQGGKKIRVEMEGKETELDRTIIEAIKDPLTHLIRNAVDHGIETPEVRQAEGKAVEALLVLRAYHEGGQVNIEIVDDGCGIDTERVKQRALERGVVTAAVAERMNDREIQNLIFLPGFSTAEKITNVSGRGVGMDVVKTNIEKIGGALDVHSTQGKGTAIKIKIPLTLAIVPALVITHAGNRYAIPQVSLLELVRLGGEGRGRHIEFIHGCPVYRLRGNLLPLVYLRDVFENRRDSVASEGINIVVLQADDRQFGLVVDEINDSQEIVVRPLGQEIKDLPIFAGATIMGDGQVALILDILGLAERSGVVSEVGERTLAESYDRSSGGRYDRQSLLVCRGHDDGRMALPLAAVSRLEEFSPCMVERVGDSEVVQYRGEIMPLIHVSQMLAGERSHVRFGSPEFGHEERFHVVVHSALGRSVGFVVDEILDIVDVDLGLQEAPGRDGVAGIIIADGTVTEILDVEEIGRMYGLGTAAPPMDVGA